MSRGKRILIIVICVLTASSGLFAIISGIIANAKGDTRSATSTTVIAKVGKEKIRYNEFYELLDYYMQSWYGVGADSLDQYFGVEYGNSIRESVIDELIEKKVALQNIKEYGLDKLSDEDEKEIKALMDSYLDDLSETIKQSIITDYTDEDGIFLLSDEEFANELKLQTEQFREASGYTDEYLFNYYREYYLINKMYEKVTEDNLPTAEEVKEKYDALLEEQIKSAEDDPEAAMMYYDYGYNDINVFVPQDIKYVKQILIQFSDEELEELSGIEDEAEEEKRLNELHAKLRPKALSIYNELINGGDFDTFIEKYSDDEYKNEEPYASEGYGVYENSGYVDSFEEESLKLTEIGQMSPLFESEYGFHIVKLVSIKQKGPIPLEELSDELIELVKGEKQEAAWEEKISLWKEGMTIKKYEDRYLAEETSEDKG